MRARARGKLAVARGADIRMVIQHNAVGIKSDRNIVPARFGRKTMTLPGHSRHLVCRLELIYERIFHRYHAETENGKGIHPPSRSPTRLGFASVLLICQSHLSARDYIRRCNAIA